MFLGTRLEVNTGFFMGLGFGLGAPWGMHTR
jgi:hypothetical protein